MLKKLFLAVTFCLIANIAWAANVIKDIRIGQQQDGIRIVLDGTQKFQYDVFLLDSPNRLVLDIKDSQISDKTKVSNNQIISGFRTGNLADGKGKRLVFNLKNNATIKKIMSSIFNLFKSISFIFICTPSIKAFLFIAYAKHSLSTSTV